MGFKRSDVFQSNYLGQDDLGSPTVVVIHEAVMDKVKDDDGRPQDKLVLHFKADKLKPWIVNSTNWQTIEDSYGDDTDGWIGKPIEVYVDPNVMFGKKKVGGVRVRIPTGPAAASPKADTTGNTKFGPAWADAMNKKVSEAKGDVAELREFLKRVHVGPGEDATIDGDPMNWPRTWMEDVKQWLDALVNVPF